MKIKSIKLEGFRRFKNLTIKDIPEETRLVVMIGPNGSGKSSVFDALLRIKCLNGMFSTSALDAYYIKFDLPEEVAKEPQVNFHGPSPKNREEWRKSVHVRSAYRNDLVTGRRAISSRSSDIVDENRFLRLSENDEAVGTNYNRILSEWIERSSIDGKPSERIGDIQNEVYGQLRDAIQELFRDPQLVLTNLGSPANNRVFQFNKGTSHGFSYENLSSGEKAALDLILDLIIVKTEFNDTIFCIDEPEAHIHTKLQGPLLNQLYKLIPESSQLWIATHSIGMVRKAQDLWGEGKNKGKDSVVFLDFGREDLDFDNPETIKPTPPDPNFWARTYEIALGDLAELVLTERTVFCEGKQFDADCYRNIFKTTHPELRFDSLGSKGEVEKTVKAANLALGKMSKAAKVIGIVDRDKATDVDIERDAEEGIRTLSWTTIESYLLDDEVLIKLCKVHSKLDKAEDLLAAKQNALNEKGLKATDNLKPIVQHIYRAVDQDLRPVKLGKSTESFMRDILAPLIQPGMNVYKQLHKDIFGE